MNFDRIIQIYVDKALEYNKDHKSSHIALLLQGKKVICWGYNQMDRQCFRGQAITSLHAEIDCLRKCRPISDLFKRNYKLLIIKFSRDDKNIYTNSKPCQYCTKFIQGLGFNHVYCSNDKGLIEKIKLSTYVPYILKVKLPKI